MLFRHFKHFTVSITLKPRWCLFISLLLQWNCNTNDSNNIDKSSINLFLLSTYSMLGNFLSTLNASPLSILRTLFGSSSYYPIFQIKELKRPTKLINRCEIHPRSSKSLILISMQLSLFISVYM